MTLPSLAQLTRFRKRCEKAHDALESASYFLLEAIRVYDGDKIPTGFDAAMAWENAHSTEAAIDALKSLLAVAEDYADKAIVEAKAHLTSSPPPEPIGVVRAPRQNPGDAQACLNCGATYISAPDSPTLGECPICHATEGG